MKKSSVFLSAFVLALSALALGCSSEDSSDQPGPDAQAPDSDAGADSEPDALGPKSLLVQVPLEPQQGPFAVLATPEPAAGVLSVTFYLDEQSEPLDVDITAPYSSAQPGTNLQEGPHTIRAVAKWIDGGEASGQGVLAIDRTAPEVTALSPTEQQRILPPFQLTASLQVRDQSPLRSASLQLDNGSPELLDLTALSTTLALPSSVTDFPLEHTLAWNVEDKAANVAQGQAKFWQTHERFSIELQTSGELGVVSLPNSQALVVGEQTLSCFDPSGTLAWSVTPPAQHRALFAYRTSSAEQVTVLLNNPNQGPGLAVGRLQASGTWLWQQPADLTRRAYLTLVYDKDAESFIASAYTPPSGTEQTGAIVEVHPDGHESPIASLEENQVGLTVRLTPDGVQPQAFAVQTLDTSNQTPSQVRVYSRTGEKRWAWTAPADWSLLSLLLLQQDTAVAVVDTPLTTGTVPELIGIGPAGQKWSYSPTGGEQLLRARLFENSGELVVEGDLNHTQGTLRRIGADGSIVWEKTYQDVSIQGWVLQDDNVVVALGERVEIIAPDGSLRGSWQVPYASAPQQFALVQSVVASTGGTFYALEGTGPNPNQQVIWQVTLDGHPNWKQTTEGLFFIGAATTAPEDGSLIGIRNHYGTDPSSPPAASLYSLVP